MTKLINADKLINSFDNSDFDNTDPADNLMNAVHIVNSMPYVEAYSKKEVIAMLNELQLEISELKSYESADGQDLVMLADIGTLFQQKINNLKED